MTSPEAAKLAGELAEALEGRTVAVAESCTAGAVASAMAAGGGAQEWFAGSLVAYQDRVKRSVLHVEAPSTVTPEAADELVRGARSLFGADVALATTGVFGDEPVDGVEPTTVVIATMVGDDVRVAQHDLPDDPEEASDVATQEALRQILGHLRDAPSV
jgi:nicotinamide-nucleotide amidase